MSVRKPLASAWLMGPHGVGIPELGDADPTPEQEAFACSVCYGDGGATCRTHARDLVVQDKAIRAHAATVTGPVGVAIRDAIARARRTCAPRHKNLGVALNFLERAVKRHAAADVVACVREIGRALELAAAARARSGDWAPSDAVVAIAGALAIALGVAPDDAVPWPRHVVDQETAARWLLATAARDLAVCETWAAVMAKPVGRHLRVIAGGRRG